MPGICCREDNAAVRAKKRGRRERDSGGHRAARTGTARGRSHRGAPGQDRAGRARPATAAPAHQPGASHRRLGGGPPGWRWAGARGEGWLSLAEPFIYLNPASGRAAEPNWNTAVLRRNRSKETGMAGTPLRERKAWQALERHHAGIAGRHLRELFDADPGRGERLTAEAVGLYLDYSKNRVTDETMRLLVELAVESGVPQHRDAMFAGEHINVSEDRAVLHVALRMSAGTELVVEGQDVVADVHEGLGPM